MCRVHHRTGQMCGQCEKGYAPPVYSYNLDCVECSHYKYNWLKYIAVAFLPLTLFYIIMVIFKIGVLSKELQAYILLSQMFTTPTLVRYCFLSTKSDCIGSVFFYLLTTLYGIWNLDFFVLSIHRFVYIPVWQHFIFLSLITLLPFIQCF